MNHTEDSIVIRAPLGMVYALAEDKARFAAYMPHVLRSEAMPCGRGARFRMAARMKYGLVSRWVSERVAADRRCSELGETPSSRGLRRRTAPDLGVLPRKCRLRRARRERRRARPGRTVS